MMIHQKAFEYLQLPKELYQQIAFTGSAFICNPPITNTDIDFIILSSDWDKLGEWCEQNSFKTNFEDYELEEFRSYKRGPINLIITDDSVWYKKFTTATSLAKQLNLLDKDKRVVLFDFVMYECNIV